MCVLSCDRWRPRHGHHDGREVFGGNDGLREEPDADERPAGTAAGPGHRPASPRSPRHQRAAVLLIDRSAHMKAHNTNTHTYTHTETMEWCHTHTNTHTHTHTHTHTQQTHTERRTHKEADTNLVLCCYQKNKKTKARWHNRIWCFSVCSKTKKKKQKKWY